LKDEIQTDTDFLNHPRSWNSSKLYRAASI